jgi:protoporphyrinogen oxidase
VVNTLPLRCLFEVLHPAPPAEVRDAIGALRHLRFPPCSSRSITTDLPPYTWIYFPHPEDGPTNRITYAHRYSPDNAPAGCASVLAEVTSVGGGGRADLAALERTVVAKLDELGMLRPDRVRFTRSALQRVRLSRARHRFSRAHRRRARVARGPQHSFVRRFARYSYVNTDQIYAMVRDALARDFAPLR